jgi:hypothetical protein
MFFGITIGLRQNALQLDIAGRLFYTAFHKNAQITELRRKRVYGCRNYNTFAKN